MTPFFKPLLIASVLAIAGASVQAQPMGGPQAGPMAGHHHRMDPAKMQEALARRQADLKAKLKLTPAQEGPWTAFTAAMQPPADMAAHMGPENRQKMHDEMAKLTTPERIDRMTAMKARHDAQMAQRNEATKALYAALTPEQQKVFDANAMGPGGPHGGAGKRGPQKS
jgi:hypothetical protein